MSVSSKRSSAVCWMPHKVGDQLPWRDLGHSSTACEFNWSVAPGLNPCHFQMLLLLASACPWHVFDLLLKTNSSWIACCAILQGHLSFLPHLHIHFFTYLLLQATDYSTWSVASVLWIMVLDNFIFILLAWYFDKVRIICCCMHI